MTHSAITLNIARALNNSGPGSSFENDCTIKPNGPEIMRLRKERGLSRERLSHATGLTHRTLRNLEEKTTYRCKPVTITTLAAFYNVEPNALIEREEKSIVRLLTSSREIIEANARIVASANKILACVGSRSRDEGYMRLIETTLKQRPHLVHYRTMALPPFKQLFQDHLYNLLKIRNPLCRTYGHKTIHIGVYDNLLKQPETSFCANETTALVVMPSPLGLGEYNTAMLIEDPSLSEGFIGLAKSFYQMGRPVETENDIRILGLVKEGNKYV